MFLFQRGQTLSPHKCFYCNQFSEQLFGSREWKCPNCEALNCTNQDGEIEDYTPPASTQIEKPPLPSHHSLPQLNSPFCQSCANNHSILMNSLASFVPDESHPDYDTYLAAYPAYRAQLEELYPLVCSACAPQVRDRLERNNYIAKARALGTWLEKSKFQSKKNKLTWGLRFKIGLWFIKGVFWCLTAFLFFVFYLYGAIYPPDQLRSHYPFFTVERLLALDSKCFVPLRSFLRRYMPFSFLFNFWVWGWYKSVTTPNSTLLGIQEYHKIQWLLYASRLISVYALDYPSSGVGVFFFLFSSLALIFSFYSLKVVTPPKISLRDHKSFEAIVNSATPLISQKKNQLDEPKRSRSLPFSPRPSWIPLDVPTPAKSPSPFTPSVPIPPPPKSSLPTETTLPSLGKSLANSGLSTGMSYTNSNEPPTSRSNHPPLAPQRFFAPEEATGLENLFAPSLRLDDEPLVVQTLKNVKRRQPVGVHVVCFLSCTIAGIWKPFTGWAGLCIIALLLGTGKQRYIQICVAAIISLLLWYFQHIFLASFLANIVLGVLCGTISWRIWINNRSKQKMMKKKR